jgi:hypothetical protein
MIALEIRFTRSGYIPRSLLLQIFDRIGLFTNSLPEHLRTNFEFIFAVTTDNADTARNERLHQTCLEVASGYKFKASVRFYNLNDLEAEFQIK